MAKADGEIMWDEFVNSLDDNAKKNYFRLNVPLDGAALIDDIEGMGSLRESVRSQPDTTRLSIVQTLLMSCFYFELDSRLRQEGGSIRVRGSIRCRVEPRLMTSALKTAGFYAIDFATDFETISQSCEPENDICSACQRFQKRVTFYVRNIKEPVCIYGRSDFAIKYRISGFPQTMEWFEKQQGLEAVFGNEVHDVPGRLRCETCSMLEYRHMKRQLPRDAIYFRRSKRVRLVKE